MEYAGFWKRFAAALIDGLIILVGSAILGAVIGAIIGLSLATSGSDTETIGIIAGAVGNVIGLIFNWLYFTLQESSSKQATFGKRALSIKVTNAQGERISFGRANGRYWAKVISTLTLLIGYFMAGFTQKKQALHDKMSDCLVINDQ